jgi:hypothetical protein
MRGHVNALTADPVLLRDPLITNSHRSGTVKVTNALDKQER